MARKKLARSEDITISGQDGEIRVILVGGTSHVGKSTLAAALGARPGWTHVSTDSLARHPGRPWKTASREVPAHVAAHYSALPVEELVCDVLRHYKEMWPLAQALIEKHLEDPAHERLVLEGSALWPGLVAPLLTKGVAALWLTASDEVLESRIRKESGFDSSTEDEKLLISKFLDRTLGYNKKMTDLVKQLGLSWMEARAGTSPETLLHKLEETIGL